MPARKRASSEDSDDEYAGAAASSAAPAPRKRARASATQNFDAAKGLVDAVLDDGASLGAADARKVAEYVRFLEGAVVAAKPKEKSGEEVAKAAEKLRAACVSGIKKQMSWKPSCKTGSAKWSYDGACTDPAVFAAMLELSAPPKWKMHKYTTDEFQNIMGDIYSSVRYDTLRLTGGVNVRYQADEGTFKFSGSYGK